MRLETVAGRVTGSYYYEKYKVPIALRGFLTRAPRAPGGHLDERLQLRLEERGPDCKWMGTFIGYFVSDKHVEGTWIARDGPKKFPFVLDRADDNDSQLALKPSAAVSAAGWTGTWTRGDKSGFEGANVTIEEGSSQSFCFDISAASGAHSGEIEGKASINGEKAHFAEKNVYSAGVTQKCIVDFVLRSKAIEIGTNSDCQGYGGIGVAFDGSYLREKPQAAKPTLAGLDQAWTAVNDRAFSQLTGKDYETFAATCQMVEKIDDLDDFGAKARVCGVRGLYMTMESIVMTTASGKIYAAVIDVDGDVLYFTNDPPYSATLPKTIDHWRERFRQKPIVYMSRKAH